MVEQEKMSQTRFTIGGREYELVPILEEGESSVTGDTMVQRAVKLNANLGQEDGQFILKHQDEIPREFRGKFYMVFAAWRGTSNPRGGVACLYWYVVRWYQSWSWLDSNNWGVGGRLVRRVS